MRIRQLAVSGILVAVMAAPVWGLPFAVQVNPSQSVLTFQLCIAGRCDTDTSPVTGTITVALDSVDYPTQVMLHDFNLALVNDLQFDITWTFPPGAIHATLTDGGLYYAYPGTAQGPVAITSNTFLFPAVPANSVGVMAYTATGFACTVLQASGYLCSDSINLADQGTQTSDWTGTVTTANRTVTLVTNVDQTSPIDPDNPSLGTIRVYGTVRGTAYVPKPAGDIDGDGDVDALDLVYFSAALGGPDVTIPPAGVSLYRFQNSDLDVDGDADLADYAALQRALPA